MSLPKLNNVPKYKTIIPSTNQEIDFRPFLVREEKILLIGLESQDPVQIATSILDTVVSCLYGEIDSNKLTSYDIDKKEFQDFIESMTQDQFSKIRAYIESIPKLSHEVKFDCVKCNENNNLTVEGLQSFL